MVMDVEILLPEKRVCYLLEGYVTLDGDCQDDDSSLNPFDIDEDGESSCEGDCDDNNTLINQNAAEICNGYDDDCDGFVDIEDSNWDSSRFTPIWTAMVIKR